MREGFVDIWHGDILSRQNDPDALPEQDNWHLLNEDEKKKALAFARPVLQQKYIKTRGVLRKILASYLEIEPQEIIFKTGGYGKPSLIGDFVYFNLSHTGNQFVVAVSNTGTIGVDMELSRERNSLSGLVDKCFSEIESSYWNALPEKQKINMFYRFWVRKEGFVKSVGRGIALGLEQCVVNPENQDYFLSIPMEYGCASSWRIIDVHVGEGVVCAVVIKNHSFKYKQTKLNVMLT